VRRDVNRWLLGRLAQGLLTWAIAVTALFFLIRLLPGDPLAASHELPTEARDRLAELYGIDQPLPTQLWRFTAGLIRGDLGTSILHGRPVAELILDRLPATLFLSGSVLLATWLLAIRLGSALASRAGSFADRWIGRTLLTAHAVPQFWLGLCFVWIFALGLGWLPSGGVADPLLGGDTPFITTLADRARHFVLPWLTLVLTSLAVPFRHHREAVLESLASDWVRSARARGLPESVVIHRHATRAALGPLTSLLGAWLPMLLTGSVLVETTFAWPGLGSLMAEAVGSRDYPLATGCVLLGTATVIIGSIAADLLQRRLDPRSAA
jgi:peptide/nickel transport system permease protein